LKRERYIAHQSKLFCLLLSIVCLVIISCSNKATYTIEQQQVVDLNTLSPTFGKVAYLSIDTVSSVTNSQAYLLNQEGNKLIKIAFNDSTTSLIWSWQAKDSTTHLVGDLLITEEKLIAYNTFTSELNEFDKLTGMYLGSIFIDNAEPTLRLHGFSSDQSHLVTSASISGVVGFRVQLFDTTTGTRFSYFDVNENKTYQDTAKLKITLKPDVRLFNGNRLYSGSLHAYKNDIHAIYGLAYKAFYDSSIHFTYPEVFSDSAYYYRSHIYSGVSAAFPLKNQLKLLSSKWPKPKVEIGSYRTEEELTTIPTMWKVALYNENWDEIYSTSSIGNSPLQGIILSTDAKVYIWTKGSSESAAELIYLYKLMSIN
jgi:hypothetical protein